MFGTRKNNKRKAELGTSSTTSTNRDEETTVITKNSKMCTTDNEVDNLALKVFLNPLLIKVIAKHLPIAALPNLRRTCKLWNQTFVTEYRKRNHNRILITENSIDTAIEKLKDCTANPFGRYHLRNLPFIDPWVQEDLIVKIGSVMTHLALTLTSYSFCPIANFRTLLLEQTPLLVRLDVRDVRSSAVRFWKCQLYTQQEEEGPKLPNLKEIALRINTCKLTNGAISSLPLINQLFEAAVNLRLVEINNYFTIENALNGIILEALKAKTNHLGKLQKIKFTETMSLQHLQTLVELSSRKCNNNNRLQLKAFSLNYVNTDCVTGHGLALLNQFLALQAPYLENLTGASLVENYEIYVPLMNSLTTLKLNAEFISTDNLNVQFESLGSTFPNLINLTVKGMGWQSDATTAIAEEEAQAKQRKWATFTRQLGTHRGITHLYCTLYHHHDDDNDNIDYLQDLARLFPNVKSLKVEFWNGVLPQVWTVWPALELLDLVLTFEPNVSEVDSCLTGIPAKRLKTLRKSKVGGTEAATPKPNLNWKKTLKTAPGISDLTCLREFNLRFRNGVITDAAAAYVIDVTGYYGFVTNPSLVRISINICCNFSQECINAVESSVGIYGHFSPNYEK